MARSKLYAIKGRRKKLVSRSPFSPRQEANGLRVGIGSTGRGSWRNATQAERSKWKPKRGRRKLGAKRKASIIRTLFQWVKVPTGLVSKRSGLRW